MRLALTGGIAEGKTTVLGMLSSLGFKTFSSDEAVKKILNDADTAQRAMSSIGLSGAFDRDAVARTIAHDHSARRDLNSVLHMPVMAAILESDADVFEVPLLYETCISNQFTDVWTVTCGQQEQLRRLGSRVGDIELAMALMASQLPSRAKSAMSDEVVRTNQPLEAVLLDVQELVQKHWPKTS